MTVERSPYDGEPYYCTLCGVGLAEYVACEEGDCKLETKDAAMRRAAGRRKVVSNIPTPKPE